MKTNFEIIDLLTQIGVPKQYAGDLLVLALYLIASIVIIFLVKKKNLGAFVMSGYLAYVVFSFSYFIPQTATLGIAYFAFLILVILMLMKNIVAFHLGGGNLSIAIKSVLISLLTLGMITSFILSWLPAENLEEFFTPFTKIIFTTDLFKLIWVIAPFLFLGVIKKYRY